MNGKDVLFLAGACLAGYLLWKQYSGDADIGGGGGGIGGGILDALLAPITPPGGNTGGGTVGTDTTGNAGTRNALTPSYTPSAAQSWSNVAYGQPGQPSIAFLANTINEAKSPTASQATKMAASAAYAGAPPRVVAKIKAGKIY